MILYRVYDTINEKVNISQNVKFNESIFGLMARHDRDLVADWDILLHPKTTSIQSILASTPFESDVSQNSRPTSTSQYTDPSSELPSSFVYSAIPLAPPVEPFSVESPWFSKHPQPTAFADPTHSKPNPTSLPLPQQNFTEEDLPSYRLITPRSRRPPYYWKDYISYYTKVFNNTLECHDAEIIDY